MITAAHMFLYSSKDLFWENPKIKDIIGRFLLFAIFSNMKISILAYSSLSLLI